MIYSTTIVFFDRAPLNFRKHFPISPHFCNVNDHIILALNCDHWPFKLVKSQYWFLQIWLNEAFNYYSQIWDVARSIPGFKISSIFKNRWFITGRFIYMTDINCLGTENFQTYFYECLFIIGFSGTTARDCLAGWSWDKPCLCIYVGFIVFWTLLCIILFILLRFLILKFII